MRSAWDRREDDLDAPDERGIDWTGIQPHESPIEPLDARTFPPRLQNSTSACAT